MTLHVVHIVYNGEYRLRELATAKRQEHATYYSTRHLAGNCTLVDTNSSTPTNEANSKQDDWLRITLRISVCVQISRHIKSLQRHRSPCQIVAGGMAANSN